MAAASSSSSSAFAAMSGYPSAREAVLLSTTSTPSQPSSLLLLDLQQPNTTHPLLTFRLQQPHSIGHEKLDFVPTCAGASAVTPGAGGSDSTSAGDAAGYVVTQADNSSVLTTHSFQSPQLLSRIILPQKPTCVQLNARYHLLAAGLPDGRIAMWDVKSGELITSGFDAHYRPVTVLRWTTDGSALISGGEDGRICVWTLAAILDPTQSLSSASRNMRTGGSSSQPVAYTIFSDHTLPITSLCLGTGAFPSEASLWSSSLDGSVKHWSLRTRTLLSTFVFPRPVAHVQLDASNRFFLAATTVSAQMRSDAAGASSSKDAPQDAAQAAGSHTLFRVDLFRRAKASSAGTASRSKGKASARGASSSALAFEARGAHAPSELERIDADGSNRDDSSIQRFAFDEPISALSLSLSSTIAIVGTASARIHLLDVASLQILRTISLQASLNATGTANSRAAPAISNLRALLTPPDLLASLVGPASAGAAPSSTVSPLQQSVLASLRAAGRAPRLIQPPILAARFDRTTRRAAAEALRAPAWAAQGEDEAAQQPAAQPTVATTPAEGSGGRPVRIVADLAEAASGKDLLTHYIAPRFFDGLLKPLEYPQQSRPPPETANGEAPSAADDIIPLGEAAQSRKRKTAAEESEPAPPPPPSADWHALQAENAELKQLIAQAKGLNDDMWAKLQALQGTRTEADDAQMVDVVQ